MTMGKKTVGCCCVMGGLLAGLSALFFITVGELGHEIDQNTTGGAKRLELVGDIQGLSGKLRGALRGVLLYSRVGRTDLTARSTREFDSFAEKALGASREIEKLEATEEGRSVAAAQQASVKEWLPIAHEIERLCGLGTYDAAMSFTVAKSVPAADKLDGATDQLKRIEEQATAEARQRGEQIRLRTIWIAAVGVLGSLLVTVFVIVLMLNASRQLREMTASLACGSKEIRSASEQVARSSQHLAEAASEQAASLEETSASTEEICSISRVNESSARETAELISQAERLGLQVAQALGGMETAIATINESIKKVSIIAKTVEGIAFQTNLLALNATIEAARAGEAGLGFAVVAEEVRGLAHRSSEAARNTDELIASCLSSAAEGKGKLDEFVGMFGRRSQIQLEVKRRADEIAAGSEQQSLGLSQIGQTVQQMSSVTQITAANSEESAAASQELCSQTQVLDDIVDRLKALVG